MRAYSAQLQHPHPPPRGTLSQRERASYWVSLITEDWRYRMLTPPKGDYAGVPLTPEARKIADAWDPAAEEAEAINANPTEEPPSCVCRHACTSHGKMT